MTATAFPPQAEKEFLASILTLAHILGWETHHEHDSRRSSEGWPDLELVRDGRHIRAECKTETGELTKDQSRVLNKLRQCQGLEVYIWRPSDFRTIQQILSRGYVPS